MSFLTCILTSALASIVAEDVMLLTAREAHADQLDDGMRTRIWWRRGAPRHGGVGIRLSACLQGAVPLQVLRVVSRLLLGCQGIPADREARRRAAASCQGRPVMSEEASVAEHRPHPRIEKLPGSRTRRNRKGLLAPSAEPASQAPILFQLLYDVVVDC